MSNSLDVFQKIFWEKQEKSTKRLEEFLKNPGEEQIHDLRTSIRRLEETYLILPNSFKKDKTNDFVSSYKSFFKKISILRDFDVIAKNLLNNGLTKNSDPITYILKQREKKIKDALKKAKKLSKLKIPSLKEGNFEKIIPKYEKVIFSNVQKLEDYFQIVASDESKVKELHLMRKTAKKLRYVLEIDPNDSYDHLIDNMKIFQEMLGEIHDIDITINFLKKHFKKFQEFEYLIDQQESIRKNIYKRLSNSLLKN